MKKSFLLAFSQRQCFLWEQQDAAEVRKALPTIPREPKTKQQKPETSTA